MDPQKAARRWKSQAAFTTPPSSPTEPPQQDGKKRAAATVKVMVLEGTLRMFLNNRVGESVLVDAGHMIILNPNAHRIPPPVEFNIARLAESSLLVNNGKWSGKATSLNMSAVNREISAQGKLISRGDLIQTNLMIDGGGTNVLAQVEQGVTTNPALLAAAEPAPPAPNEPLIPPQDNSSATPKPTPGPGPGLPGFEAVLHYGVVAPKGTPQAIIDRLNK